MKKTVLALCLLLTSSILFTSCREERSGVEETTEDIESAADDVTDDIDDM